MTMGSELLAIQFKMQERGLYAGRPDGEWGPMTNDGILRALATIPVVSPQPQAASVDWPNLPRDYDWVRGLGALPRHVSIALGLLGTVEVPGAGDSPIIMGWRDEMRAAGIVIEGYSSDATPWCGLACAYVMFKANRPVVDKPLWALNWNKFGVDGGQPELGDVLTFIRNGGGHVGIYIAEDAQGFYHLWGGNQGDKVSIARIAKSRMKGCRQPDYQNKPASARPYLVAPSGVVSRNEA